MIAGAVVAAEAALLLTDTGPNIWLVAALVALIGAAIWFVTEIDPHVARPPRAPRVPGNAVTYPDLRTTSLRQALAIGASDSRHTEQLRRRLVAIVDNELRTAHGIDRATHPDAARAVLGDELDRFVSVERPDATLTPRGIERVVSLIEQL